MTKSADLLPVVDYSPPAESEKKMKARRRRVEKASKKATARVEDADLVILNTCHIREKAADKVYSELGRIRMLKQAAAQEGRRVTIAVAANPATYTITAVPLVPPQTGDTSCMSFTLNSAGTQGSTDSGGAMARAASRGARTPRPARV